MAANEGWYSSWFSNGWFPSVWFAPGDESGVPDDELRLEYRGGTGRMRPAKDPFADATDADLERLVRDKWEAIERANPPEIPDRSQDGSLIGEGSTAPSIQDEAPSIAPAPPNIWVGPHIGPPAAIVPIGPHIGPVLPPVPMAMDSAVLEQARLADLRRRQAQEDEALILALLEA